MDFNFCIIAIIMHIVVASMALVKLAKLKINLFFIADYLSIIPTIVIIFVRATHTILFELLGSNITLTTQVSC